MKNLACPVCLSPVPAGAASCPKCKKVTLKSSKRALPPPPARRTGLIVVAGVALAGAAAAAVFLLMPPAPKPVPEMPKPPPVAEAPRATLPPAPKSEAKNEPAAPSMTDEMDRLAEQKYAQAKQEYEKGNLFDAMQLCEESRRMLEAMSSLFEQRGNDSAQVRAIADRVRRNTEFLVLCRKSAPGAKPSEPAAVPEEKKPDPAPVGEKKSDTPPDKPSEPDKERRALVAAFAAWLNGLGAPEPPPADALAARLRAGARSSALLRGFYAVLAGLQQQEWTPAPEEISSLKRYAERLGKEFPDEQAFAFLLAETARIKLPCPALRILTLAHLESLRARGSIEAFVARRAAELDLSPSFNAVEGEAVEAIVKAMGQGTAELDRAVEGAGSIRDPFFRTFRTLVYVFAALSFKGEAGMALNPLAINQLSKGAVCGALKSAVAEWKTTLTALKPCKWCKGTHQIKCDYGCDEQGEITKKCAVCNGTGRKPGYAAPYPCPENCPKGHTWKEPCPKCKGTRSQPCKSCKAPWQEPPPALLASQKPCEFCGKTGLIFFKLLCPDCHGLGSVLGSPLKKK